MNKGFRKLSKDTEEFLNQNKIPYIKIDGTIKLIILKSNSTHHYCAVEFFEVDDSWYAKKKPFKFQRIWGNSMQAIKNLIDQYLNS